MADKRAEGVITAAAGELDAALDRFERTTAAAVRMPLTSQRNLEKAAEALTSAAEAHPEIAAGVQHLMTALNTAQERSGRTAEQLRAFGEEVAARSLRCRELLSRFGTLGEQARGLSEVVRSVGTAEVAAQSPSEKVARLTPIEDEMASLIEHAASLVTDAREAHFEDVAKQADSLRQQVQSLRNKVGLLVTKLQGN